MAAFSHKTFLQICPSNQSQPSGRPIKYICGLGARFGCERGKRTFKPLRLKSQIYLIGLPEGVSLPAANSYLVNEIGVASYICKDKNRR